MRFHEGEISENMQVYRNNQKPAFDTLREYIYAKIHTSIFDKLPILSSTRTTIPFRLVLYSTQYLVPFEDAYASSYISMHDKLHIRA